MCGCRGAGAHVIFGQNRIGRIHGAKSAFYAIAKMIENLNSYIGNSCASLGMALGDYETIELNKFLETFSIKIAIL